jgi:tetratricopeptide (TPR) repeat protein
MDANQGWALMCEGKYSLAYDVLSEGVLADSYHYTNRGLALLCMHRLEEAVSDFDQATKASPHSDSGPIKKGIALWWLGRYPEAVSSWRGAIDAAYTDAAGGVEVPSLLLFAASRLNDADLERQAKLLLRKVWKPSLKLVWPGPIAGYLLGKLDSETFLVNQTFKDPILEARRLSKALFWQGLVSLRSGDQQSFVHRIEEVSELRSMHAAVMLEPEYWLAHAELEHFRNTPV